MKIINIRVQKLNEVLFKIDCERSTAMELSERFSFYAKNFQYHPRFQNKVWDGKIRLFNLKTYTLPCGLKEELIKFAEENGYSIEFEKIPADFEFSVFEAEEFIKALHLPEKFEIRPYQMEAFVNCVRKRRLTALLPTASGKSLLLYLLTRIYSKKTLLVVPRTALVLQMASDFEEYGYNEPIHKITSGVEKLTDDMLTISTWQSIYKMPKNWFNQFSVIIVDEVHEAKADSLTSIMNKCTHVKYRFGVTGTTDNMEVHEMCITGLFGEIKRFATTAELIKAGYLAEFSIKSIVLKYPEVICKIMYKQEYHAEIDYIVRDHDRNVFLRNLVLSLKGNTLLLFQFVEKHGEILHKMIADKAPLNRKVFYIAGSGAGKTDAETREEIRRLVEKEENAIIIASIGTSGMGTNMVRIHNAIFASPSKSKIRNLQAIGRYLRKGEDKTSATLYDIVDDLSTKSYENYALKHFKERMKIYNEEEFPNKIYYVDIGK